MDRLNVNVRRHAKPDINPETGGSLDSLSSEGIESACNLGKELYSGIDSTQILGFHSPKQRARETIDYIFANANIEGNHCMDKRLDMCIPKEHIKKALLTPGGEKRPYNTVVQWLMDNPDSEGISFTDYGNVIVSQIQDVVRSFGEPQDEESFIEEISHGPLVEAAYINLLERSGKKIDQIEDMGGGLKPLEGFNLKVDYKDNTIYTIELQCRDLVVPMKSYDFLR